MLAKSSYSLFALLFFGLLTYGQDTIRLSNGSFEGNPGCCKVPSGWRDCGEHDISPPDIHPSGIFDVVRPAYDGYTYLGMVVRQSGTKESVSQKLVSRLKAGVVYVFEIAAAMSPTYNSPILTDVEWGVKKASQKIHSFVQPVLLKVYGSNRYCNPKELLATLGPVDHFTWEQYVIYIKPESDCQFLILQADYNGEKPYNGHILIDNASDLVPVKGKN